MSILQNNCDFLFLYDATLCNPNGDPDQENKPRMDYDTNTNLVTDIRLKRSIRDYLKAKGNDIFVDMEGDTKVSPDSKLEAVLLRIFKENIDSNILFAGNKNSEDLIKRFEDAKKIYSDPNKLFEFLQGPKEKSGKHKPPYQEVNYAILAYLIKQKFVDIRMFGSAFAIATFNKAYTGAIQINWGYSLHEVELVDSNTIVTIMNDDNSTFGKDYRLYYSLLAFNGTMNKYAAITTGLKETEKEIFRDAIWNSISANPTRSKLNQYPKLYLEIIYNDGFSNGYFGDLRKYVIVKPKTDKIRGLQDLEINLTKLKSLLDENKGEGKAVKEVYFKNHTNITY